MTEAIAPPAFRPDSATVWWRDFLDETGNGISWGYAFAGGWAEITLLGLLVGFVWVGLSLAWLGAALEAAATTVLVHDSYALPSLPAEARLVTRAFVAAVVLVLDGVAALVVSRWTLRGQYRRLL